MGHHKGHTAHRQPARNRPHKQIGPRNGTGMYSSKKWVTEAFKHVTFRRDVEDIPKLFQTKGQAERAIRRLEKFDELAKHLDEFKPLMMQRIRKNSTAVKNARVRRPPAHILMRAAHARLWLAQFG